MSVEKWAVAVILRSRREVPALLRMEDNHRVNHGTRPPTEGYATTSEFILEKREIETSDAKAGKVAIFKKAWSLEANPSKSGFAGDI